MSIHMQKKNGNKIKNHKVCFNTELVFFFTFQFFIIILLPSYNLIQQNRKLESLKIILKNTILKHSKKWHLCFSKAMDFPRLDRFSFFLLALLFFYFRWQSGENEVEKGENRHVVKEKKKWEAAILKA